MFFKTLAAVALISSNVFASSVTVESLNLIRGMDGRTVRCDNKEDYIGRAKHGAYLLTNARLKTLDGFKASLNIEIQTLRCVDKGEGQYRFELMRPDEDIVYSVLTGHGESVEVRRCTTEGAITIINDDYLVLSEDRISETSRGRFGTQHEVDFRSALSKAQMQLLESGKVVKFRMGLMKRGLITTTASNGYVDGPILSAGGIFYLLIELSLNSSNQIEAKIIN